MSCDQKVFKHNDFLKLEFKLIKSIAATGEPPFCMAFSAVCAIRHALQSARLQASENKSTEWFSLGNKKHLSFN